MARLMFIASSAYPLGGVQVWLDYIVDGLAEAGHEVIVGLANDRFHDADHYLRVHPFADVVRIQPRRIIQIFHRPGKPPVMRRNF